LIINQDMIDKKDLDEKLTPEVYGANSKRKM
jgi:hypothetical protein